MSRAGNTETHSESRVCITRGHKRGFLLHVGDAEDCRPARRMVPIGHRLEIGRHPPPVSPAEGTSWALSDHKISASHARISRVGGSYELRDLDSRNGTVLDGRAIERPVRLNDGALIFIGNQAAVFRTITKAQEAAMTEELESPLGPVPTASPALALVCQKLKHLARSDSEILLIGETGAGKEVYAHAIHRASGRAGPMMAVNCAAIPRELAESELFGYVKGAHSTAHQNKPGLFQRAEGGTLLLDEIGEMPFELQPKLLRFLQDRILTPLGSVAGHRLDVRIIAATSGLEPGRDRCLRDDLASRLGAQPLRIPPLRDRIEDLGVLFSHFLRALPPKVLETRAFRALCLHGWPRNVRELEKVATEAAALSNTAPRIGLDHLPDTIAGLLESPDAGLGPRRRRPPPTREELQALLRRFDGSVADVARELDRQWAVVYRWVARYGLENERTPL